MNVLNKLALKNLKLNKKRSVVIIIGIILATALICTVAGMGTSLQASLVENAVNGTGYYHLEVKDIELNKLNQIKNNRDVKSVIDTYYLGTSYYENNNRLEVESIKKEDFDKLSYKVEEGKYPSNKDEIVLTKRTLTKVGKKIGDTIELNIGKYHYNYNDGSESIDNTEHKVYKIVGELSKKGYSGEYYGITTNDTSNYFHSYIILKNPKEYKTVVSQILTLKDYDEVMYHDIEKTGFDYSTNNELLRWEAFSFSDETVTMLYGVIGIVAGVIVITSVICIRNSFAISVQEKKKMYGMLSSVGATKKQIKTSVLKEAFVLGIIGIPLGIILGIFAVYVLTHICNLMIGKYLFETGIAFKITILPIILAIILGTLTIYFSALGSAKKTSKISPIEALRENDEIKITSKELKTPKIISKCFKTGGVIAYKNLKRNKKKYKTTVISLTISVLLFIVMSSFVIESQKISSYYYTDYDYNIVVKNLRDEDDAVIKKITDLPNLKNSSVAYTVIGQYKIDDRSILTEYASDMAYGSVTVIALDNTSFKKYSEKVNVDYEKNKDKGILIDEYSLSENGKEVKKRAYTYEAGDKIKGKIDDNYIEIEISKIVDIKPYGYENHYYDGGFLIINYDVYKNKIDLSIDSITLSSTNHEQTVKSIKDMTKFSYIYDKEQEEENNNTFYFLVNIFLYGFIIVITLIGVTNIFNTITSNMELRKKEFAMLKSIGMTKKEFERMINLETIMYSIKSLIYGIVLGILGSLLIHQAYSARFSAPYKLPVQAIIICIVSVFILIYIIMRYSIKKCEKQNIIETIRNDNI